MEPQIFDFYYLLVEILFGNILYAGLALVVVFILMATLLRMSPLLQIFIIGMFVVTFGIGYGGAFVAVVGFIGGVLYFFFGLYNAILAKMFN